MSQHKHAKRNRENKRVEFSGNSQAQKSNSTTKLVVVIVVLAALIVGYLIMGGTENGSGTNGQNSASLIAASRLNADSKGEVSIPLADLGGKANFYDYVSEGGRKVRFFAMKSSDGVYRAALDACDVCFAAKKGYYQDGDDMVCKKCGNHFPSAQINEVHGGCNPIGINRKIDGDRLVIKASELGSGSRYF